MFDESPIEITSSAADFSPFSNFIMGDSDIDDWGTYYEEGDSFVRVDIPVSRVLKVAYSISCGWSGAIFVRTVALGPLFFSS